MKSLYAKIFELRKIVGRVKKDASNPFFKTKYADLGAVIDATDPALDQVGLIYIDRVEDSTLISAIVDPESGDSISSRTPLLMNKQDMQSLGSAVTYARRYARMALLGLQAVDDYGQQTTASFVKPKIIKQIQTLLMETGTKAELFLDFYNVTAIKDLRDFQAEDAVLKLEAKKANMEGN